MAKLIECVPNFSEGRDTAVIEALVDVVRSGDGVKLLDYAPEANHNRTVVTFVGSPAGVEETAFRLASRAAELIDMRRHKGEHPRMGAMDVCPFIPVSEVTMAECADLARRVGRRIGEELSIPVYLYEEAAVSPARRNLADIRKGQYEGFFEKIRQPEWAPDFGPAVMNAKSGCSVVGARFALVAYNVNLGTDNIAIANTIARNVRHLSGGLRFVKAMGVQLADRKQVQVSMNLVNYEKTTIYRAHEMVKMEAKRYGVPVVGSEIIGLVPLAALVNSLEYYLQLENFRLNQVLENRLSE
ncbi:MAG: glutamate formimidoyltransferase [bacterium]|jgi:glutamate formiminotransferase